MHYLLKLKQSKNATLSGNLNIDRRFAYQENVPILSNKQNSVTVRVEFERPNGVARWYPDRSFHSVCGLWQSDIHVHLKINELQIISDIQDAVLNSAYADAFVSDTILVRLRSLPWQIHFPKEYLIQIFSYATVCIKSSDVFESFGKDQTPPWTRPHPVPMIQMHPNITSYDSSLNPEIWTKVIPKHSVPSSREHKLDSSALSPTQLPCSLALRHTFLVNPRKWNSWKY